MGFPKDFVWGAATAAYQIEGAQLADGKGASIWDSFSSIPGKVLFDQNGNIACDHYHRYKEDVKLMSELGIQAYRFSVSWARVCPNGDGAINEKGLDFYDRLVDALLKYDITPYLTLYHWDMPYALEKKGGFRNRDTIDAFAKYTDAVTKRLGDRCKHYFTLNEPQCFLNLGYKQGIHAPGHKLTDAQCAECMPNILLCHGIANKIIRENVRDAEVSFAACGESVFPARNDPDLIEKVREFNFSQTTPAALNWFADAVCLGKISEPLLDKFPRAFEALTAEDMKLISTPVDSFGFNIYTADIADLDAAGNLVLCKQKTGEPVTAMGWPIREDCLYWMMKYIWERYQLPIIISENGMASPDRVSLDGKVHDALRIDYLARHISAMERAIEEGVAAKGYFTWSFMDNFEWSFGYEKRFGLVYVDYETQKRTVKDSGYWYRELIKSKL